MHDVHRNPRDAGPARPGTDAERSSAAEAVNEATPAERSSAAEAVNEATAESPAVDRWEEEGGIVAGPGGGAVTTPAEPAPDYKDRWLRAEAELQNFRRRTARDREEGLRAAEEAVLMEVVAALDDLDRALASARAAGAPAAWLDGVTLVAQRLGEGLARRGITVEDPLGQPFDPLFHEAMLEIEAPPGTPAGTIVQVSHKGYRRGARALRPARVVVARAPAGSSG